MQDASFSMAKPVVEKCTAVNCQQKVTSFPRIDNDGFIPLNCLYFYSMAKKKSLQQLDMFSLFAEPVAEKGAIANDNTDTALAIAASSEETASIAAPEKEEAVTALPQSADTAVIFNDGKINVKIKPKPVTATIAVAEPIVFIEPVTNKAVAEKKPKEKTEKADPLKKRGRKSFKEMDNEVGLIDVPTDEVLQKKLYYPISEVAGWFKVNASLIRAWENEFDILQPRKNRKGDRLFRVEDIKNLQMIYYLLRNRKFSIDGAKQYLKSNKKGADTNYQLIQSLTKFRSFLLELKANLGA